MPLTAAAYAELHKLEAICGRSTSMCWLAKSSHLFNGGTKIASSSTITYLSCTYMGSLDMTNSALRDAHLPAPPAPCPPGAPYAEPLAMLASWSAISRGSTTGPASSSSDRAA